MACHQNPHVVLLHAGAAQQEMYHALGHAGLPQAMPPQTLTLVVICIQVQHSEGLAHALERAGLPLLGFPQAVAIMFKAHLVRHGAHACASMVHMRVYG